MAVTENDIPVILASRDSLLALAQTIDAALRLKNAGFKPRIQTRKTAGDLKLDAPLYQVAGANAGKEGRAFFTRELDDALLSNRADAAVHSFKDLPAEKVPGISDPVFFSETTGADLLVSGTAPDMSGDGKELVIGTSSLRRIHQLSLTLPAAETRTLRGNIVTRLKKLMAADQGINTILIAAAGIERLTKFSGVDPALYAPFLEKAAANHISGELKKFRECIATGIFTRALPEEFFPTAPGQGVLALQLSAAAEMKIGKRIRAVFSEHDKIAARVMLERAVMTGLETGCHAPLGVSAFESDRNSFRISLCFSRTVQTEPLRFDDPVFLRRQPVDVSALVREVKAPFRHFFWWGFKDAPTAPEITGIRAIEQMQLTLPAETNQNFIAVFAASEATFPYLEKNPQLTKLKLFAAGSDTASALKDKFPGAQITVAGRGFAAVLNRMPGPALWLGSASGEARARSAATGRTDIEYRAVYDNTPVAAEKILAAHAALKKPRLTQEDIHLVTSAAAALSFVNVFDQRRNETFLIACFGTSAAEILAKHGFTPCHISEAGTFAEFWAEMRGDAALMRDEVANGK